MNKKPHENQAADQMFKGLTVSREAQQQSGSRQSQTEPETCHPAAETGPTPGPERAGLCDQELSGQLTRRVPIKGFNPQRESREVGGVGDGGRGREGSSSRRPDEASERMIHRKTSRRDGRRLGGRDGDITISGLLSHWLFGSKTLKKEDPE